MKNHSLLGVVLGMMCVLSSLNVHAAHVKVRNEMVPHEPIRVIADGTLEATPKKVWENMIRFNDYASFMPHVMQSYFISEEGVNALRAIPTSKSSKAANKLAQAYRIESPRRQGVLWNGHIFMAVNMPFPVENRWYILAVEQDERQASRQEYKRCWSYVTGNIDSAHGCWSVAPSEIEGQSQLHYEDNVSPGGHVPQWISKIGATQTVPEMFESLEKVSQPVVAMKGGD